MNESVPDINRKNGAYSFVGTANGIPATCTPAHPTQGGLLQRIGHWLTGRRAATPTQSQAPHAALPATELDAAITAFFCRCDAQNLAPNTLSFYHYRFAAFIRYLTERGLTLALAELTPQSIRDFLVSERQRVSEGTAARSYIALRVFCSFLVEEGYLVDDPMATVKKPKVTRKLIPTFTAAQMDAMLQACGSDFIGCRDRTIIYVLFDCGLRVSELCGIRLHDIEWSNHTIRVTGKGSKERIVRFGEGSAVALQIYLAEREQVATTPMIFVTRHGQGMNRQGVYRALKACGERAGVKGVRISPHTLRHTCALTYRAMFSAFRSCWGMPAWR